MSKAHRYVVQNRADRFMSRAQQRKQQPPTAPRRKKMSLTSDTKNPLIERAGATIQDTCFLESWGLQGGKEALQSRVEWYGRLLAQTEAFEATLTDDEKAALSMPPCESTQASGRVGAPPPSPDRNEG